MIAKLSDRQRKSIIAERVEGTTIRALASKYKVSTTTIQKVLKSDDELTQRVTEKKEENVRDMMRYLADNSKKAQDIISLCLDTLATPEKIMLAQPQQISTVMGTVIDKFAPVSAIVSDDDKPYRTDSLLIADGFQPIRRDILERKHTEYVFPGGRGSTKSSFVSLMIVELLKNNPNVHALAVRQVGETLKDSVYSQIEWAIQIQGLSHEFIFRKAPIEIIYKKTGQKIYFRGADDPMKIKSIKPPFGYIGVLWFEELDQMKGAAAVRSIEQSAIRGGDFSWIFKTFNTPKTRDNWANKELDTQDDKRLVFRSSYKTALVPPEWLGTTFIERAEHLRQVNPTAYEHEYDGIANGVGGMVFENVVDQRIKDGEIEQFDRLYMGVDWGWYPDPWAFNKMHYSAAQNTLYVFQELQFNKKSNKETHDAIVSAGVTWNDGLVICDSAEPKSIGDYQVYGKLRVKGAEKGPGSVDYSMKWLQSLNAIVIDRHRCPLTWEEFANYEYERNKDDEIISGYPDKNNHHIDAIRYAMNLVWKVRGE